MKDRRIFKVTTNGGDTAYLLDDHLNDLYGLRDYEKLTGSRVISIEDISRGAPVFQYGFEISEVLKKQQEEATEEVPE